MEEPLSVLSSITSNPDRVEELEKGVSLVSEETGRPLKLICTRDTEEILGAIPDAHIYLTYRLTPAELEAGPNLKWIHFGAAGVEHSVFPELIESGVLLTTGKGMHADVMAEYALMGIIALAVGLPMAVDATRRREWVGSRMRPLHHSIGGKNLLVLGLGHVGLPAAQLAAKAGMKVTGIRRTLPEGSMPEGLAGVGTLQDLDRILPGTDYLLITLPVTPETRGLITEERLRLLPADAGLVNMGRGVLLDETALLKVLDEGHLRGAVLDCFQVEPLPPSSPFWEHPRVLVTPHISGNFDEYTSRTIELFCDNLRLYLKGEALPNPYDPEAGY